MKEIRIPFKGWDLITFLNEKDGNQLVAVRPIAEAIGVGWGSQWRKIQKNPRFSCIDIDTTGKDGKTYTMLCLPVKQLNGWLYGINANKVKDNIRPKLLQFQEECHMAIYNHMSGSANSLVVETLMSIIKELKVTNQRQSEEIRDLKRENQHLAKDVKGIQETLTKHNRMLGLEASVAGKRLAAARHLKIVS